MQVCRLLLSGWLLLASCWVWGDEVLLRLVHGNGEVIRSFTRSELAALPQHSFSTITAWTQGSNRYRGPALARVLEGTGAHRVQLVALNGYRHELTIAPFEQFPAILAMSENDTPLTRRNKGPLWLLLPFSDLPALKTPENEAAMVWQLITIEVTE
ncbi:hypothetical protein G114_09042 [Aeromonas diversa CDC 2478-85]|uniref:Oxidoreductase molybdopterin-binding domain-containing protein n=1 Tax=Aeromonas diversa CDC 2478-85 TaxID=1268237 RepID=N9VKX7_9GAMM|nr:hypothetical protein [Aeromonas diversa]ENY72243.1 hypothetical protein G114_09042 [Aeromonas diversa CDC 2478-85]